MPRKGHRTGIEDRFWAKVDKRGPDECWIWTANRLPKGYGLFRVEDKMVKTHRLSYEMHKGPIPKGLWVLHTCDNPPCVNPTHLWVGTNAENVADKETKGRGNHPRGAKHGRATISEATAREIRATHAAGLSSTKALAERFGIATHIVHDVVHRRSWRHVE